MEPSTGGGQANSNHAPVITSEPVTDLSAGDRYLYQASALDADGDSLVWSLVQAPSALEIEPLSGLSYGTNIPAGENTVRVKVEDGNGGTATQEFSLTVHDGPAILSVPPRLTFAGTYYRYHMQVSDTYEPLVYTLLLGPPGMKLDSASGVVDWPAKTPGTFDIQLEARNSLGKSSRQAFTLTVMAGDGVVFTSTPVTEALSGRNYMYPAIAVAAGGTQGIVYSLSSGPPGMTIDQVSGRVEWLPDQPGVYRVEIVATNSHNRISSQRYALRIYAPEETGRLLTELTNNLFQDLEDGNFRAAGQYMTVEAQARLGPVFEALLTDMPGIIAGFSQPVRMHVDLNTAEYLIRRTQNGDTGLYVISFVRDTAGLWKINSM